MNLKMSPALRTLTSLLFAAALLLASILPASAYNEAAVKHVRLRATNAITCGSPIHLVATLTDSSGNPVVGAQVIWSFKKGQTGDVIHPPTSFSDAQGKARADLTLGGFRGVRIIKATVAAPGKASDQLTISAKKHPGCNKGLGDDNGGASSGGSGGNQGGGGIGLPPTNTAEEDVVATVVAQSLPIGAALAASIGIVTLLYAMRRSRGNRLTATR